MANMVLQMYLVAWFLVLKSQIKVVLLLMFKARSRMNEIDKLSDVPEAILGHILSFLTTKDVVRTSILSRRWKYLWTSVTSLHFCDPTVHSRKTICDPIFHAPKMKCQNLKFMNFVEKVLNSIVYSTIKNFYLSGTGQYDESRVYAWICLVIIRNVHKIEIDCPNVNSLVFPSCLYTTHSLKELKVVMPCTFKLPNHICFSNLKLLELSAPIMMNENFPDSCEINLNFPVLEILEFRDSDWFNVKVVNIEAPALRIFVMEDDVVDHEPDCVVKIYSRSLSSITCHGYSFLDINFLGPSSATDVTIDISSWGDVDSQRNMGRKTASLLGKFSNVKNLTLSCETTLILALVDGLRDNLPMFENLISLSFGTNDEINDEGRVLVEFLQKSPVLESLSVVMGIEYVWMEELVQEMVPECLVDHLKAVRFQYFTGTEHEVKLLMFLLKNSKVLEEMSVVDRYRDSTTVEAFKHQLSTFPRGSDQVSLHYMQN